jgi:hypothetical protein
MRVLSLSHLRADAGQPARPLSFAHRNGSRFTIYDLFFLAAICAGIGVGGAAGAELHGMVGGAAGALAGGWIGFLVGRLPELLVLNWLASSLTTVPADELRDFLHDPDCHIHNLVLLELQRRGENIHQELGGILDMMAANDVSRRGLGWAALNSAFPDLARQLGDYSVGDSAEECRRKIRQLRSEF